MSSLTKPILRGHFHRNARKHTLIAIAVGVASGAAFYFFSALPRHKAFYEFLNNYDAEEHYELMRSRGYLQSDK